VLQCHVESGTINARLPAGNNFHKSNRSGALWSH
jgi:hypothetical protein